MAPNTEENFNKDELEAPSWLNIDLFTTALHTCQKDDTIKVKSLKLTPATAKGDHYASVMFRASVDYECAQQSGLQSMSMIIKTMPELEGHKKDMLQESFIFETEIAMYCDVIPKFESILRKIGDETVLGARCLYYSLAPKKFIIFEDIVPLGYVVLRDRQMNLKEVKAAYLKLAKWHAISYKIHQEDPAYFGKFRHSLFDLPNMDKNDFMTDGIIHFIELLDTQPELQSYKPYFEAIKPYLLTKCKATYVEYREQPQDDAHYVLNHGDFHCKNMMFKHDPTNGRLEDVMLLDFQLCNMGPMVNDLIYSIYVMLDQEMRTHNMEELFYYYFSNFVDTLQRIGYNGTMPKLIEFREMLMRHRHYEIFMLVTFLPMWYAFRSGEVDPEVMMNSEDYRKKLYFNTEYIDELHVCLPRYLHAGYLDN